MDNQDQGDTVNVTLDSSGKPRQRAISNGEQAFRIAEKLKTDQDARSRLEAVVDRKYNGDLPFRQQDLVNAGESWRNNFSTGFMSGIIGRVIPAPVGMIDGARSLTASKLCYSYKDAEKKTEYLRDQVTKYTRNWNNWKNFQYGLWTEVVLHGGAIVANLNPYSPWPEMYRTDRAFLPVGTGQHASNIPFAALMKDYLVHEFVEFIKDKDTADAAGWDTEAAINAVNDSLPSNRGTQGDVSAPRSYEDAIREGNPGASFSGAKVIQTYHVLAVESDTQKVTHYIINRQGKHEVLFQKDDRFDRMEDVITLFTLEPGNGTFYGAKGMGRMLLNMHIACEANRCLLFDQLRMAGMTIFKTDPTKSPSVQMRVRHPFLILSGDGTVEQQQTNINVESFIQADDQLLRWAEQYVGSYISDLHGQDQGPHATATEEQIRAQREQQSRIAFLSRAFGQHAELMSVIQKRLLDKETSDKCAKDLQKENKEYGITDDEIEEFLSSITSEQSQDVSTSQNQELLAAYQLFKDDPNFDQHKLRSMVSSAVVNSQFTKDTLLDEQGMQVNEIEAYRAATGENEDMIQGASVPASPRDPHETHLKVHLGEIKNGLASVAQNPDPKVMDSLNLMLRHVEDGHISLWEQAGGEKSQIKPYSDAANLFEKALVKVAEGSQKTSNDQSAAQTPPPQPGTPQGAPDAQAGQSAVDPADFVKMYVDDGTPESIKRQIEAGLGLKPADTPTVLKEKATTAVESHPDLPVKIRSEGSAAIPPPSLPDQGPVPVA